MSQQTREVDYQANLNSDKTWLEGTIKVKDNNGNLVQFFPKTTFSSVKSAVVPDKNLHDFFADYDSLIAKVENTGSLEIMKEEPDASNTQSLVNETLIAWYAQPSQEGVKHLSVRVSKSPSALAVVGNAINFTYSIINDGEDYPYENISITNPVTGNTHQIPTLENDPFKTVKITESYSIKESDVLAALANEGNLEPANLAVTCTGDTGVISVDSEDNFLNVWKASLIKDKYDPFITVSSGTDTYGTVLEGETIQYHVSISNATGTSINNLSVASSLAGSSQTISLDPHESSTLNYTHTANSTDMFAGEMSDTISISGTSFANTPISHSRKITYKLTAVSSAQLVYTDLNTGKRSVECSSGDAVSYKASILNTGTVTLYSLAFHDNVSGEDKSIASLAPGAYAEYEFATAINSSETMELVSGTLSARNALNGNADIDIKPLRCYVDIPAGWRFKVAVDSSYNYKAAIPFSLYQQGVELSVDWGDGSTSTLTSSDYTYSSATASVHTYNSAGEYTITVDSSDWESTYICSYDTSYVTKPKMTLSSSGQPTASRYACVGYFRLAVSEILNPIPALQGTNCFSSYGYDYVMFSNRLGNPFQSCVNLTSIPSNLFAYLNNIQTFDYCFADCSSLASIPSGLFANNTNATSFEYCFSDCSSLTSIPAGLFDNNTNATSFESCFNDCSALTSIPSGLFANNTAVTSFYSCFETCSSLISIPAGLFDNNTAVTNFSDCFAYCSALTSIPAGLFANNTAVKDFSGCFRECLLLQSIPAGLFDNNTAVTTFQTCFDTCSALTFIPSGLFNNNTAIIDFSYCFSECSSLTSIPAGLFDNNPAVTDFSGCFDNCSSLTSIPAGLFDNNPAVTDFSGCFASCFSLTSIPAGLFAKNLLARSFSGCFYSCYGLLNFKLTIGSFNVVNFNNFVSDADNVVRIVCVPPTSNTYATLYTYADTSNNITISVSNVDCSKILEYTIDTEAATTNATVATIPLAAVQNASSKLSIDWGDGNGVELTPSNVTPANLTHSYSAAGEYQITISTENWLDYQFLADSNASSSNALVQTFRNTVVSIDEAMPPMANATLDYFFYNCAHLESYSSRIFDNLPNATSAVATFKNCASLQAISAGTLRKQTALTSATEMFAGCILPTNVPSGLLSQCRQLTAIDGIFSGCSSLTTIPSTLMLNNASISSQSNAFTGCANSSPTFVTKTQLETNGWYVELYDTEASQADGTTIGIPYNLTDQSSVQLTVDWGDGTVQTLTSSDYPSYDSRSSLHSYSNKGLYFVSVTSSDWSITYPETNVLVHMEYEDVTEVDDWPVAYEFVRNGRIAVNRHYEFNEIKCVYTRWMTLIEVATNLPEVAKTAVCKVPYYDSHNDSYSSNAISITYVSNNFDSYYGGCVHLKAIPSGLFSNNTAAISFNECFVGCSSLQSIPSGLFDNNTAVTNFSSCFEGCSSLQSIPSGLFDNNTAVTSFQSCFYYCSSLQSIPSGLFDNNALVETFFSCFESCTSLTSIPSGLLATNTAAINLSYCFYSCSSLNDFAIHIGSSIATNCSNFATKKTGTSRTVYVPTNSTTYNAFSSVASNLGLTVIGE